MDRTYPQLNGTENHETDPPEPSHTPLVAGSIPPAPPCSGRSAVNFCGFSFTASRPEGLCALSRHRRFGWTSLCFSAS